MAATRVSAAQAARRLVGAPAASSPTLAYMNARSAQAIRQKQRVRAREQAKEAANERRQYIVQRHHQQSAKDVRQERRARREDWELGALAPSRHLMDERGAMLHGALSYEQFNSAPIPEAMRKDWGIEVGDRVVVVRRGHRDRGKIGRVQRIDQATQTVTIERINVSIVEFPPELLANEPDRTPFRPQEQGIPLGDVRLVVPLFDSQTDVVRDSVIETVRIEPARSERGIRVPKRRFVAGTHPPLEIPSAPEPEGAEYDGDTLRIEVEERSWTPTLSEPPMPPSVIDELRNPYSKFRTRHDPAWLMARDADHLAAAGKHAVRAARMITPLEERRLARAADPQNKPKDLDDATLEHIGALMAQNLNLGPLEDSPRRRHKAKKLE